MLLKTITPLALPYILFGLPKGLSCANLMAFALTFLQSLPMPPKTLLCARHPVAIAVPDRNRSRQCHFFIFYSRDELVEWRNVIILIFIIHEW